MLRATRSSVPGWTPTPPSCCVGLAAAVTGAHRRRRPAADLLAIECDSSDVLKRILVESDALTFMPRFVVDDDVRDGRLAVVGGVDLGLRVRFGAAWLRGRTLGRAGTAFLDLLRSDDHAGSRDD